MTIRPITALTSMASSWAATLTKEKLVPLQLTSRGIDLLIFCCAINCIRNCNRVFSEGASSILTRSVRVFQATLSASMGFILYVWKGIFLEHESLSNLTKQLNLTVKKQAQELREAQRAFSERIGDINSVRMYMGVFQAVCEKIEEQYKSFKAKISGIERCIQQAQEFSGFRMVKLLFPGKSHTIERKKAIKKGVKIFIQEPPRRTVVRLWSDFVKELGNDSFAEDAEKCARFLFGDVEVSVPMSKELMTNNERLDSPRGEGPESFSSN